MAVLADDPAHGRIVRQLTDLVDDETVFVGGHR
jgi:hypothetical protein